jgi:hypothetical protein
MDLAVLVGVKLLIQLDGIGTAGLIMAADEHPKRVWQANGTSEEKGIPTNSAPVAYHP